MVFLAFACLGFLVGNLIGLSAESTLGVVMPLLFAFGGGSALAFLHQISEANRRTAAKAVVSLTLACLVGTYAGIVVSERQWLTPVELRSTGGSIEDRKVLRSLAIAEVDLIDTRYKLGEISAADAYERLHKVVINGKK